MNAQWIGIPWVRVGDSFDGCDCWGLVRLFYRDRLGIELPSLTEFDAMRGIWTRTATPEYGNILLFRRSNGPHVGIVVNECDMLHVDESIDSRIEQYRGLLWKHRLKTVYQYSA